MPKKMSCFEYSNLLMLRPTTEQPLSIMNVCTQHYILYLALTRHILDQYQPLHTAQDSYIVYDKGKEQTGKQENSLGTFRI